MPVAWSPEFIRSAELATSFAPPFNMCWAVESFSSGAGNGSLQAYGFNPLNIANPGSVPAITISMPELGPADGHRHRLSTVGFAGNGDAWFGYTDIETFVSQGQYLAKVSASKLTQSGPVAPDWSFALPDSSVASSGVAAVVIRSNGDLWVSTIANDNRAAGLYCYSAASIATPGAPAPTVVLAQPMPPSPDNPSHTNSINDFVFDSLGNIWFANAVAGTLNKLSAAQLLATDTSITPSVVLTTIAAYTGVALDTSGNLWAARGSGSVDMFAAADIVSTGVPAPQRVINGPNRKVRFDQSRNMWAPLGAALDPGAIAIYSPADILATGSPAPRAILTGGGQVASVRTFAFAP